MKQQVILITGGSGIGYQTAGYLAKEGHVVYAVGRRVEKITPLKSVELKGIKLNLINEESVKQVANTIISQESQIDVLINNAGDGSFGAVKDVTIAEAKKQFEMNLFGLARLTQLVSHIAELLIL